MSSSDGPSRPPTEPLDVQTYTALCHCGTVQYTVTLDQPLAQQKVVECNCSICSRNGYLTAMLRRDQLVLKSGEEALRSYTFGPKRNTHKFCGRCGSAVFYELLKLDWDCSGSPDLVGVNVGGLDVE
jgi:hypothetical protein